MSNVTLHEAADGADSVPGTAAEPLERAGGAVAIWAILDREPFGLHGSL
jgi:hypothetical protein